MIKNILFDMGNVLIRFDSRFFIHQLGITGEDEELLVRQVYRTLEWVRMDRGSLTEAQATRIMCSRLPERFHETVQKLVSQWELIPIPGMYELVRDLKQQGYGIYLLSNASFRQHDYWPNIPGSEFFDGTFISCDHGIVKPQPEIYHRTLEAFGLKAEECVFIDDLPANIEGAFYCGIPGIVFHGDVPALRAALNNMGIAIE